MTEMLTHGTAKARGFPSRDLLMSAIRVTQWHVASFHHHVIGTIVTGWQQSVNFHRVTG
ncbi:hypothetical protein KIH79_03245 [Bifidobacterium sp. 82T10]|uniref:Transposase n=1 Tax=Bifidobacterium miconis TaxID=2834435 RepID=A0ABS6WD54_9BIFI|nr:hypothetical protein [Bifidobacterium miconis]MBW3091983.1 hypothetical protein [Bifidobacterium miconis]